LKVLACK